MISITAPAYNEAENLEELCRRLIDVMDGAGEDFEILIVDNGSSDNTLEILKELHKTDKRVKYISLSRNFGHQGALIAGLHHCRGDAVISMDADIQHPPQMLPAMIKLWREGFEVVFTNKRVDDSITFIRKLFTQIFYNIMSVVSGLKLSYGQSDFRLLDRKVVDVICSMQEREKFLRGLVDWAGFRQVGIDYDVEPRFRGSSKFPFLHLVSFALNGIFSFTRRPLRIFIYIGLIISLLSILMVIINVIEFAFKIYIVNLPPGWLTIVTSIYFFGGVILFSIGILGEYIGYIFNQTKARPEFIVKEEAEEGGKLYKDHED